MRNSKNKKTKKTKLSLIVLIIFLVLALGIGLIVTVGRKNNSKPHTTSKEPSAQSEYTHDAAEESKPVPQAETDDTKKGTAVIEDTSGEGVIQLENAKVSDSKELTIYSPLDNELLKSGHVVTGVSTLDSVQYRIIDDVSGVISMGFLKVVSGKFSGSINFNTSAKEGRVDFFATKPDGTEYSSVDISVRFR